MIMCGILFEVIYLGRSIFEDNKIRERLTNRGPDSFQMIKYKADGLQINFMGAVLWMQGQKITVQPTETESAILLYNGDIFDESWDKTSSDTEQIMSRLNNAKNVVEIVNELKCLKGPYSLIYYDKKTSDLYFTRDKLGRNSMLFHKSEQSVVIGSVLGRQYDCIEVPASHIQILNLKRNEIILYPWSNEEKCEERSSVDDWYTHKKILQSMPDDAFEFQMDDVLCLNEDDGVISYIENVVQTTKCSLNLMENLLQHKVIQTTVHTIIELLEKSLKMRLLTQPQKCKNCLNEKGKCNHSSVGVLFSGGLDCTIIALLADKYLPEEQAIDLLNVAFIKKDGSYDVPDRLTGKMSVEELMKLCPLRKWNFKEINVDRKELEVYQKSIIADLVYPRQTILDESLGSALWFAAKGNDGNSTSACRVLLVGSGADELFGGYTRHKNAYKRHGWTGLQKELLFDWNRISFRNLSRDNRVICDHGRQPRMPYLDEDFTKFVLSLKPWLKCFPNEALGKDVGMKLMLRIVAYKLGLKEVMTFPKRALQFGSKIANSKENGADISQRFKSVIN